MSTLLQLRQKLRQELKIDPNGRIWSDVTLDSHINSALEKVQADGDFRWHFNENSNSESTVIGQASYDLPTNFVRIEYDKESGSSNVLYNSTPIQPADYRWLFGQNYFSTNGVPSFYALRNNKIYLAQPPDAIETLAYTYISALPAMASDSTDSGVPSTFDDAIVKWAAYKSWSSIEGREQKGVAAAQDYNEFVKDLFARYLGRRDESNYQVTFETV